MSILERSNRKDPALSITSLDSIRRAIARRNGISNPAASKDGAAKAQGGRIENGLFPASHTAEELARIQELSQRNGILSLAGLKREDVYIANVLKCRPPGNRNPRPEEVLACSPFLREQIRSIWPDIIVTLGNPATHFVLKTEIGITKLRGRFHQMGHFVVMPTFHPAAALRNPAWQELLEEDFKMLGDYLERHPAPEDASE